MRKAAQRGGALVSEGSAYSFWVNVSADTLPMVVACNADDVAVRLSCGEDDLRGGEWQPAGHNYIRHNYNLRGGEWQPAGDLAQQTAYIVTAYSP